MRAVLDTNVVVSALIWGGKPLSLLQAATEGDLLLFTSPILIEELKKVLMRRHLAERLASGRLLVDEAVTLYAALGDRHLLVMENHAGIRIVTPADALLAMAA